MGITHLQQHFLVPHHIIVCEGSAICGQRAKKLMVVMAAAS